MQSRVADQSYEKHKKSFKTQKKIRPNQHRPSIPNRRTTMKKTRTILSALLASVLSTCAAHAQFGSGIVYDPTQSAHALQQLEQGSQIYTTAVATRNQIVTMYNLAHQ